LGSGAFYSAFGGTGARLHLKSKREEESHEEKTFIPCAGSGPLSESDHPRGVDPNPAPKPDTTDPSTTAPRFSDVAADAYYADAVAWAIEKNITAGTSQTTFSPNVTCTEAQILTFLWHAKGSPAPSKPVSSNRYYAQAAAWAVEQGLVDEFEADIPCTRAMVVSYLWKLAGSPAVSGSVFTDVPAGSDYAQAVAWAVENGITSGTSRTTFSPDTTCTRGQIVTFLYRDIAK